MSLTSLGVERENSEGQKTPQFLYLHEIAVIRTHVPCRPGGGNEIIHGKLLTLILAQ